MPQSIFDMVVLILCATLISLWGYVISRLEKQITAHQRDPSLAISENNCV
jgi:hypothetical protein